MNADLINKVNIDFSQCNLSGKKYGGSMLKVPVVYKQEFYMLKMQEKGLPNRYKFATKDCLPTYFNSVFSEFISSHIGETLELEVHSTLLGKYPHPLTRKPYNVVACKDFLKQGERLDTISDLFQDYNTKANAGKKGLELNLLTIQGILNILECQTRIDPESFKEFFWDMFVFDGYVGNFDRNPTNWGVIVKNGFSKIAPIFDNGSSLHPQTPREFVKDYLKNPQVIIEKAILMPTMSFRDNIEASRIKYYQFIQTSEEIGFLKAINKLTPKIIENFPKHKEIIEALNKADLIDSNRANLLIQELDLKIKYLFEPCLERSRKVLKDKGLLLSKEEELNNKLKRLTKKKNY